MTLDGLLDNMLFIDVVIFSQKRIERVIVDAYSKNSYPVSCYIEHYLKMVKEIALLSSYPPMMS